MGLFGLLALALGNLMLVLMDVTVAFLVIRVLALRFRNGLLSAFDRVGSPIVDEVTRRAGVAMEKLLGRSVSSRAALAASLICLTFLRVALVTVLNAMLVP
jgi:hypothetical protein